MTAVAVPPRPRGASTSAGVGTLLGLTIRRDRIRLPVWIVGITLLVMSTAASYAQRYPTIANRAAIGDALRLPATVALVGPYRGGDAPTYGAMVTQAVLGIACVLAALMSIFAVVRYTRTEEESGRAELVLAAPVGRQARLAASLIVVIAANAALGALIALALPATGVDGIGFAGSIVFGAAVASVGLVFAAVAAVTAQISEYGRGAAALAGAVLGVAYALRAIGDVSAGWLSWLSPIGWAQAAEPFVATRAWPLVPAIGSAVLLMAVATRISSHRDLGTGLVPPAPGPPSATALLGTPGGLAFRLHRVGLVAWAVALAGFGLAYGSILGGADDLLEQISALQHLVVAGSTITDSFAATLVLVFAILVAVFAVQTVLKVRAEETAGHAEVVLATATSRPAFVGAHAAVAILGGAVLLAIAGAGLGVGAAISLHDAAMVATLTGAALAYVPALWVVTGFAVAVVGLLPRWSSLAWLGVAYPFAIYYARTYLSAPAWSEALSPYSHVSLVPAERVSWWSLLALVVVAAALIAVGIGAFRRRDVMAG
jgi:polyether ionophore transport system permease protein